MRYPLVAIIFLASLVCAGCAADVASPTDARSAQFKSTLAAPGEKARVYLLPTYSKGLFEDLDGRAVFAIFPEGGERGAKLGATTDASFLAFDIQPGSYGIQARGDDPLARVSKTFDFEAGKSYFLRPAFFRSAKELANDPAATQGGMDFDMVAPSDAAAELAGLDMATLTPEGDAFIHRTTRGRAPLPAEQSPQAPIPPAGAAAPSPSETPKSPAGNDFTAIERKLQELKQLRDEGLITQEDYDSKRNAVLNAY